ncbi:MAG: HD family hydrolase [Spirochaetales bacterium]|nr:HD family hydrolase [Spirochaetales bacterium]
MEHTQTFENKILGLFKQIHPLDRVPRAGYLLRGVPVPESVSAHSHFLTLLAILFLDEYPEGFDREKVVTMAVIHDLPEALLMDIPMPVGDGIMGNAKRHAEQTIFNQFFKGFPDRYKDFFEELIKRETPEARLVAALDKVQMMIKILWYTHAGWGNLEEFWDNPENFRDCGIPEVKRLHEAIAAAACRKIPTKKN